MTIVSTANMTDATAAIVAEVGGSSSNQVDIMIGIGLVKDSEAVFFQYVGEDGNSQALMRDNGKPVTRIAPVRVTGLSVAEDIGEFKSTKLNLFVETQSGRTVMLTSGLQTIWSQCVLTGLMGMFANGTLDSLIAIDTWKGNSKMKPCFAAIRNNGVKQTSDSMYEDLAEARGNRDKARVEAIMRDAVAVLSETLTGVPADVIDVTEERAQVENDF
tara:strand:- start:605 stop:1252 length:648 start_codon:yes stop_codon:yes gene_type:complete